MAIKMFFGPATGDVSEFPSFPTGVTAVADTRFGGTHVVDIVAAGTNVASFLARPEDSAGQPFDYNLPIGMGSFSFAFLTLPVTGSEEFASGTDNAGAGKIFYRVTSTGKVQVYASNGTTQMGPDSTASVNDVDNYKFYYKIGTGASANWDLWIVNHSTGVVIDFMTGNGNLGTNNLGRIRFGKSVNRNGQTVNYRVGNCILDSQYYYGPQFRTAILPATSPTATHDFVTGTGTTVNEINAVPANDAAYWMCPAAGAPNESLVNHASCASVGIPGDAHILGVMHIVRAMEDDAAVTSSSQLVFKSGATTLVTTAANIANNMGSRKKLYRVNPDTGLPWKISEVDAIQSGIRESNNVEVRVSAIFLVILWIPNPTITSSVFIGTAGAYAHGVAWEAAFPNFAFTNEKWVGKLRGTVVAPGAVVHTVPSNPVAHPVYIGSDEDPRHYGSIDVGSIHKVTATLGDGVDILRVDAHAFWEVGWIGLNYAGAVDTSGVGSSSYCKSNGGGYYHHLLIWGNPISGRNRGLSMLGPGCGGAKAERVFVIGIDGVTDATGFRVETPNYAGEDPLRLLNCSVFGVGLSASDFGVGIEITAWPGNEAIYIDNKSLGNGSADFAYPSPGATGVYTALNNLSSDATGDDKGSGNHINKIPSDVIMSVVTPDLHLKAASPAIGVGIDTRPYGGTSIDINGRDMAGETWDIGAHQYSAVLPVNQPLASAVAGAQVLTPQKRFQGNVQHGFGFGDVTFLTLD